LLEEFQANPEFAMDGEEPKLMKKIVKSIAKTEELEEFDKWDPLLRQAVIAWNSNEGTPKELYDSFIHIES
jgi:hypothetical protein